MCELTCHDFGARRPIVEGRHQREDGRAGVGGSVHIADVNLIEGSLANAQHERALLFEANVGSALDEVGGDAIGDPRQCPDAAWNHHHRVSGVRTAGHVGSNIGVRLFLDFKVFMTEQLLDEVIAATDSEFLCHDAQPAVGGDEVCDRNTLIALDRQEELLKKQGAARTCGGDGQVSGGGGRDLSRMLLLSQVLAPR